MKSALCDLGPLVVGGNKVSYDSVGQDGAAAVASFNLFITSSMSTYDTTDGSVIVGDWETAIRRVWPNGTVGTFAGTAIPLGATATQVDGPRNIARFSRGVTSFAYHEEAKAVLVADASVVRAISAQDGSVTTVAGTPSMCSYDPDAVSPATAGCLTTSPIFIASAKMGARDVVYVASQDGNAVMRISPGFASVATLAGQGPPPAASGRADGLGTNAMFTNLMGIAARGNELDDTFAIYTIEWSVDFTIIPNTAYDTIRYISAAGLVRTIVATSYDIAMSVPASSRDGSPPVFRGLTWIKISADGTRLFTVEQTGYVARVVDPTTGEAFTLLGNTTRGTRSAQASTPAISMLNAPLALGLTSDNGSDIQGWVMDASCRRYGATNAPCLISFTCRGTLPQPAAPTQLPGTLTASPSPPPVEPSDSPTGTSSGSFGASPTRSPSPTESPSPSPSLVIIPANIVRPTTSPQSTTILSASHIASISLLLVLLVIGCISLRYGTAFKEKVAIWLRLGSSAKTRPSTIVHRPALAYRPADATETVFTGSKIIGPNVPALSHHTAFEHQVSSEKVAVFEDPTG